MSMVYDYLYMQYSERQTFKLMLCNMLDRSLAVTQFSLDSWLKESGDSQLHFWRWEVVSQTLCGLLDPILILVLYI